MTMQQRTELTASQQARIRAALARGAGQRAVATEAGVSRHAVRRHLQQDRGMAENPVADTAEALLTPAIFAALSDVVGTIELQQTLVDDGVPGRPPRRHKLRITVTDPRPAAGDGPDGREVAPANAPVPRHYDVIVRSPRITRPPAVLIAPPAPLPVWSRSVPAWLRAVVLLLLLVIVLCVSALAEGVQLARG